MISEWYQVSYNFGGRQWFVYKMIRYDDLHGTIDSVLKIDGVEEIKIEILPDEDDED